jgi:endonuclease G
VIPDAFYKVLLINDFGYKGIGFYCENIAGNEKLSKYVRSIDEIEEISGIDFFHRLPDEIEEKMESEYDWDLWR